MIAIYSFLVLLVVATSVANPVRLLVDDRNDGKLHLPIPEDVTPEELVVIQSIPIPKGDEPIFQYTYEGIEGQLDSHEKETLKTLWLLSVPIYRFANTKNYSDIEIYAKVVLEKKISKGHFESCLFAKLMCKLYRQIPDEQLIELIGSPTEAVHQPFAVLLLNLLGRQVPLEVGGQRDGMIRVMDYNEELRIPSALAVAYLGPIFKNIKLVASQKAFMRNSETEKQKLIKFTDNLGSGYPMSVYDSWKLYPANVSAKQNSYYECGLSILAGDFFSVQVGGLDDLSLDRNRSKQIILNYIVSNDKVYPGYFATQGEAMLKHASVHDEEEDVLVVRSTLSNGTAKVADRVVLVKTSSQTIVSVFYSYDQVVLYASASLQEKQLQPNSNVTVVYTGKASTVEDVDFYLGEDSNKCSTIRLMLPNADEQYVGKAMGKKDEYLTKFSFQDEGGKFNAQWNDDLETFVVA